jgi:hypothetical protein
MEEIAAFLPRVGKDNLSSMVSLRELDAIGLPPAKLGAYRRLLGHAVLEHPGEPGGARAAPRAGDGVDYRPFVEALKSIGSTGTISLPGDAGTAALEYCRRLWSG